MIEPYYLSAELLALADKTGSAPSPPSRFRFSCLMTS
jgi:hypothetical protein